MMFYFEFSKFTQSCVSLFHFSVVPLVPVVSSRRKHLYSLKINLAQTRIQVEPQQASQIFSQSVGWRATRVIASLNPTPLRHKAATSEKDLERTAGTNAVNAASKGSRAEMPPI